jgi:large subunit ribosomal protein L21e
MATRIGTARRKTRHKLSRPSAAKGTVPIRKYMQKFKTGDKVLLKADSFKQDGMYHPRFHGRVAVVRSARGKAYEVAVDEAGREKILIVSPVHLRKV